MCDVMENQHRSLALGGVRNYSIWRTKIVTVIRTEVRSQYLVVVGGGGGGYEDRCDGDNSQSIVCLFIYTLTA